MSLLKIYFFKIFVIYVFRFENLQNLINGTLSFEYYIIIWDKMFRLTCYLKFLSYVLSYSILILINRVSFNIKYTYLY